MKTIFNSSTVFSAFAGALFLFLGSCEKINDTPQNITQNVSASLKTTETYTLALPKTSNGNTFEITTVAAHSSLSQLATDASGNLIYQYTPASNFSGQDHIVISTVGDHNCAQANMQQKPANTNCNKDNKCSKNETRTIYIDLTVVNDAQVIK